MYLSKTQIFLKAHLYPVIAIWCQFWVLFSSFAVRQQNVHPQQHHDVSDTALSLLNSGKPPRFRTSTISFISASHDSLSPQDVLRVLLGVQPCLNFSITSFHFFCPCIGLQLYAELSNRWQCKVMHVSTCPANLEPSCRLKNSTMTK